ncbi:MAG: hypothetical protein FWD18_05565 [Micrococcales bacterium]|nr:hypothetical protein [Micrococcales bacterium]
MTGARARVDLRTVALLVVLDALTFVLVYWLLLPPLAEVIVALDAIVQQGLLYTLVAVRLTLIGMFAARSLRRRRGLRTRGEAVPSLAVGAVVITIFGVLAGVVSRALLQDPTPAALDLVLAVVFTLVFPLFGLLFVAPGEAERPLLLRRVSLIDR